jgi:hypothetical protein
MLLLGAGVGGGSGWALGRIVTAAKWGNLVKEHAVPTNWIETRAVLRSVVGAVIGEAWAVLAPMVAAGVLVYLVVSFFQSPVAKLGSHSASFMARICGDVVSITCGGLGLAVGIIFGLFLLRKGLDVPDEELFSFLLIAGKPEAAPET